MNSTQFRSIGLILSTLGLIACGDQNVSAIAAKHNQICEVEMNATNCPADADLSGLIMFCKMTSSVFLDTEDCNTKMDAYVACNAERAWACLEGGEVPVPVQPDTCSDEDLAPFILPSGECVNQSKVSAE